MQPLHPGRTMPMLAAALVAAGLVTACQPKVENQDAFKTQVERIDRTEKDVDAIRRQLSVVDRDQQQLRLDVNEVSKKAPAAVGAADTAQLTALQQRLQGLENQVKDLSAKNAAYETRLAKLESRPAPAARTVAERPEPSSSQPESSSTKLVVSRSASRAESRPAKAEPAAIQQAPRGVYHTIGVGETIDQIAKAYKVPVRSIQAANRIPAGHDLIAGQQIYVPRAQ